MRNPARGSPYIRGSAREGHCRVRSVADAFNDPNIALGRIAQDSECGLVAGAVVGGDRLGETIELDQSGGLIDAGLINLGGAAEGEVAPATGKDGRTGKLGVFGSCRRIGERAIADDPVCLGHAFLCVVIATAH